MCCPGKTRWRRSSGSQAGTAIARYRCGGRQQTTSGTGQGMLHDQLAAAVGSRYSLERELPAGGMARVFLARDPILDRAVVVKVLPPERATATAIARFQREAKLLARLNHPHIVPILDSSGDSVPLWFAMPWIAGESLAAHLASGPLPHEAVRTIGIELLDALQVKASNAYSKLSLPERPLLLVEFHGSESGVAEQSERCGPWVPHSMRR